MSAPSSLREMARALGGEVVGGQVLCPGPGHSSQDRSLSVRPDANARGGFVCHSFGGDDWRECRDQVAGRLGFDTANPAKPRLEKAPRAALPVASQIELAMRIWAESIHPHRTPVQRYLNGRGLELPDVAAVEAVRFHPHCPFAGEKSPAMICLVRNIVTDSPVAIHRTALTMDCAKSFVGAKSKMALGPVAGGAIKLTPDSHVTVCIGIGEGVETTLSMRHIAEFGGTPVWCVLNAGGIKRFPALPGIETLWIAVDDDPKSRAGIHAASVANARWRGVGREVIRIKPTISGADINDLLVRGRNCPT